MGAAADKTLQNEQACAPIKFYLQNEVSQIWPVGHSLPSPLYGVPLNGSHACPEIILKICTYKRLKYSLSSQVAWVY